MMIEMKVSNLGIDPTSNMPFVLLRDSEQKYLLPIWIGIFEASAIASQMEKIETSRPMTHDLLRSLIDQLEAKLTRVEIHDLRENTFFASLVVEKPEGEIRIDSRPSDAIALALRTGSPIWVDEDVIQKSSVGKSPPAGTSSPEDKAKWEEILQNLSPEAFGKYKM